MSDRLMELEVKVAFQENMLAELDQVIQQMRDEIEQLQREVQEIRSQQEPGEEDPDQRPPHY